MKEEIEKLKQAMKAMKDIIDDNNKEKAYQKAINLNLVPKGPTTPAYPTTPPIIIDQSRLILLSVNEKTPAEWTKWSSWQKCFCGKQLRTRICQYDDPYFTKGCVGKSYESRPCNVIDNCPTTAAPQSLITPSQVPPFEASYKKPLYKPLSVAIRKPDDEKASRNLDDDNYVEDADEDSQQLLQPLIID
ncbi:unnamed protein product [Gongylonema pulchrum]|uniref:Uncharacterized protein n=1 Tax=Gongylonema pulchrum TaxID=637853 RepID=A0A183D3U7_9BILA|nr:unnamed protein product [Gongylonema pulchrum]